MHTNSCGKFFLAIGEPFKYYIAEFSVKEWWWGGGGGPPIPLRRNSAKKQVFLVQKRSF